MAEACALEAEVQASATSEKRQASQAVGLQLRHQIVWIQTVGQPDAIGQRVRIMAAKQLLLPKLRANRNCAIAVPLLVGEFVGHVFLSGPGQDTILPRRGDCTLIQRLAQHRQK